MKLGASLLWTSICDDDKMDDVTILDQHRDAHSAV